MGKRKEEAEEEQVQLTEDERRALRGSKFAPLPSHLSTSRPRLAHPGGPLTTNKAAALAKFLQRKLKDPGGLSSINPDLLELAVNNAKDNLRAASAADGTSSSGTIVRHVDSFGNSSKDSSEEEEDVHKNAERKNLKQHKKEKKKKRKKDSSREEDYNNSAERKKRKKHKREKKTRRRKKAGKSTETEKSKHKKKFKS